MDPFDPTMVGLKFPKIEADIVTISHDHNDHNYVSGIKNHKKVIEGPGEYEISGISIIGISTYHDNAKGEKRGKNTVFVIESEGIRVCHLGDLGSKLDEKTIEKIGDIDILMVPVGGEFTIDATEAVEITKKLQASITIPIHYKQSGMKDAFEKLSDVDAFLKLVGLPVEKSEKLNVSQLDLVEMEKVVVFES